MTDSEDPKPTSAKITKISGEIRETLGAAGAPKDKDIKKKDNSETIS